MSLTTYNNPFYLCKSRRDFCVQSCLTCIMILTIPSGRLFFSNSLRFKLVYFVLRFILENEIYVVDIKTVFKEKNDKFIEVIGMILLNKLLDITGSSPVILGFFSLRRTDLYPL